MLNNDVINPYSKTEFNNAEINQTSFCDVNTNNSSSGLRENAILTNFGAKILLGYMTPKCIRGWGATGGEHLK